MLEFLVLVYCIQMGGTGGISKSNWNGYIGVCVIVALYYLSLLFIIDSFSIVFNYASIFDLTKFGDGYLYGKLRGFILAIPVFLGVYLFYYFNKKLIEQRFDEYRSESKEVQKKKKRKVYFFLAFSFFFMVGIMIASVYLGKYFSK